MAEPQRTHHKTKYLPTNNCLLKYMRVIRKSPPQWNQMHARR
jgi:hypothetical protein